MAVSRERSSSNEERSLKKQKIAGLSAGPAIRLQDPAPLAQQYQSNRPYKHISVGALFDDAVVGTEPMIVVPVRYNEFIL
jgi:hypothetical protein